MAEIGANSETKEPASSIFGGADQPLLLGGLAAVPTGPNGPLQFGNIDPNSPEGLDKQRAFIQDMQSTFQAWADWRRPMEYIWSQIYASYLGVIQGQKIFTRARVFVPVAFQIVEAAVPKLVNIIIGASPFFEVQPEDPGTPAIPPDPATGSGGAPATDGDWPVARVLQKILEYQLAQADFFTKFVDFAKQLMMYGTSYFYVYWKVRRDWVITKTPQRQDVTEGGIVIAKNDLSWQTNRDYKVVERRPEIDVLDIGDVFPDPEAQTDKDGNGVFILTRVSIAELKELGKGPYAIYANTDQLDTLVGSKGSNYPLTIVKSDRRAIRGVPNQATVSKSQDSLVEVITFWGRRDLDGDGIREEVQIVMANKTILLRAVPNPFEHGKRPIIRDVLFPVPKEWYGLGLVEPVLPLISEMNTLRNQSLDVNELIINRMWKVNSMADVDVETLIAAPNGVVLTDMMDGLTPLEQQELPQSVYEATNHIQSDIENTTAPRSVQGTPESGALGRTARGAQLIIGQALEKFGLAAKLVEDSCIKRLLRLMHQLNLQFIDNEEVWSKDGFYGSVYDNQVAPEMLRAEIKFKMLGVSDTLTKEAKINQIISFLTVFKGIPGIDFLEAARLCWSLMDAPESANKIIQPAPFPSTLVQNQTVSPPPGPGGAAQSVAAQVQNQGASVPTAVPGARSI